MNDQIPERIVVVGASAGGVQALGDFVRPLAKDLPFAVFIVLHLSPTAASVLPAILTRAGHLPAKHAENGETIRAGHIYVAPPDHHMLVEEDTIVLNRGPKENSFRPAVDTLFRSAAQTWGPNAVGVILSGLLDDGAAGMLALQQGKGLVLVQSPKEALYPSMANSALRALGSTRSYRLKELTKTINDLAKGYDIPKVSPNQREKFEVVPDPLVDSPRPKEPPAPYACPNCNGSLYEVRNDEEMLYFRCRVGHGYSGDSLIEKQADFLDDAMWTALRALEERRELCERLNERMTDQGHTLSAKRYLERALNAEEQAAIIRHVLIAPLSVQVGNDSPELEAVEE